MQIKIRAWDKDSETMIYGVGITPESDGGIPYQIPVNAHDFDQLDYYPNSIIMLYTGLKDKNGLEIYEGDIVRIWGGEYCQGYWEVDEIGEVVFEEYSFGTKSNGRFHPFNIAFEPYDLEIKVIGNIFEHPHLLEAKGNE